MKILKVTNRQGISAGQMREFLDGVPDDAFFDVSMINVQSGTRPVIGLTCDQRNKRIDIIWAAADFIDPLETKQEGEEA